MRLWAVCQSDVLFAGQTMVFLVYLKFLVLFKFNWSKRLYFWDICGVWGLSKCLEKSIISLRNSC